MTTSAGTDVTTVDRKGITALLRSDEAKQRITPLLRGVEYDRIVGEAYLAAGQNPEILLCTPVSIIRAVARAVSWGLVIGETVHLVPFNVKVSQKGEEDRWEKRLTPIQDYKGKIELVVSAGGAKSIDAQVVYEKERFEYIAGTDPTIVHVPSRNANDRGAMIGAYAVADHGYSRKPTIVYMPLADIDAIRKKNSKQWKEGPCPPWYARKTAVHQLAKMLPKNARLMAALRVLEDDEEDADLPLAGEPVATIAAPPAPQVKSGPAPEGEEHLLDDRWIEERDEQGGRGD